MVSGKKSYHRGDVRPRLVEAAVNALRTQPLESVSLRKLAQSIGVSHNAPYMHFADKEALWVAVSDHGFELLSAKVEAAISRNAHWKERLMAGCEAYVRFAMENRQHMLVMFRNATPGMERRLSPRGSEALQILQREVGAAIAEKHLISDDPQRLTITVWMMLHGLAMAQIQLGEAAGPFAAIPQAERVTFMLNHLLCGIAVPDQTGS